MLAGAFFAVALIESQPRPHPYDGNSDGYQVGSYPWNVFVMLCFAAPLVVRRRGPRASFLLMHGSFALFAAISDHSSYFFANTLASMLSVYSVARFGQGRVARWAWLIGPAAFTFALLVGAPPAAIRYEASAPVGYLVVGVVPWVIGRILRRLSEQSIELQDAVEGLSRQLAQRQAAVVTQERARIAIEMHNVVEGAVKEMVAQVTAAQAELERAGVDVPRLHAAVLSGDQALKELASTLGVLRENAEAGPANVQSLPGLQGAGELAKQLRAAGLEVRLEVDQVEGLSASLHLAAYRILQEAMTNALKHGGQTWVSAAVLTTGQQLTITVRNPVAETAAHRLLPSGRHGLIGMHERAAMFGGSLRTGLHSGLFEVCAVLPFSSSRESAGNHESTGTRDVGAAAKVLPC